MNDKQKLSCDYVKVDLEIENNLQTDLSNYYKSLVIDWLNNNLNKDILVNKNFENNENYKRNS